jgi:hypothetical protein
LETVPTLVAPEPTLVPTPETAAASPEPPAEVVLYDILIAARGEDSLIILNRGDTQFPLGQLSLAGEIGQIEGAALNNMQLQPGECVALVKNKGKPKLPDTACDEPELSLEIESRFVFWKKGVDVYYADQYLGRCERERCPITLQVVNSGQDNAQVIEVQEDAEERENDD